MADETTTPTPVNRNPLSPPMADEATYQKLADGSWLGIISYHASLQTQFKGASKEECQAKVKEYTTQNS